MNGHQVTVILLILFAIVVAELAIWAAFRAIRRTIRRKPPDPHTVTCPCPICGTTIPLTVHQIPTLTVRIDRTDLAAHLLTHEEI